MAAPARAPDRPTLEDMHRVIATAFDPQFYRAVYTDLPPGMEALWHYRMQGWREARDPAPWFSAADYLLANPDVKRLKIDPLHHYLTRGRYEGREVAPSRNARAYHRSIGWSPAPWGQQVPRSVPTIRHADISERDAAAAMAGDFDAAYYLAAHPDVAASGMDPLEHFLVTGWIEGRDPTATFSLRDYLGAYPDVAQSGLNPFAHFLIRGRAEGRAPRHNLGFEFDVILRTLPVEQRLAAAIAASQAIAVGDLQDLTFGLGALGPDIHLTFSHDNYAQSSGGLQLCVRRESAGVRAQGRDHLHLYPAVPWPTVRAEGELGPLGVLINGQNLGVFSAEAVAEAVQTLTPGGRRTFAIHSQLGHAVEATLSILTSFGLTKGVFWLHDFASLCAGFHLQRNDVVSCGAPPADSAACGVCLYGAYRSRHTQAHAKLFEALDLTVVSPSDATLAFWREKTDLQPAATAVLPHAKLVSRGIVGPPSGEGAMRVAFLGMPTAVKGWPVFRDLAERLADDPRYVFYHLGGRRDPACRAQFRAVTVSETHPNAMRDAVEALGIDAALIWSLCRETFSFTAYEAAAGGALVVTGPDSGNVATFAANPQRGRVIADAEALTAAFEGGEALAWARAQRTTRRYGLTFSSLTADLLEAQRS